jgi:hypothetical protein
MTRNIRKICEWTKQEFFVDFKHRNQRFINKAAMYSWRKSLNREMVNCLNCEKKFERYKRIFHPTTKKLTQYCSNRCNTTSDEKKKKLRKWISINNPMNNIESINKIKSTKLLKYGNSSYNNLSKCKNTMIEKYGVACSFDIPNIAKSNGKRVSKFQKSVYENIKSTNPDAILEHYLPDVKKSVDIYIPKIKKIIECFGDYWHCNPLKCKENYYNSSIHKTAKEIWEKDKNRIQTLKDCGYDVEIVWENSNKFFK